MYWLNANKQTQNVNMCYALYEIYETCYDLIIHMSF